MNALALVPYYITWHYTIAFRDIFRVWTNFLWFIFHFFSIGPVLKTFFSPWRRLGEEKGSVFDIKHFATALIINTYMRVIGVTVRTILLVFAFSALIIIFLAGLAFFVFWALAPLFIVATILNGVGKLF